MSEQAPAEKPAPLRPVPAPAPRPAPFASSQRPMLLRTRFLIGYLVLAAVLGAAAGAFVLMLGDGERNATGVAWSDWQPAATGTLGVREIARHIAPKYQLADGTQLVGVVAGPMSLPTENGPVPVRALVLSSGRAGVRSERIDIAYPEAGAFYQMCGAGANCSIPGQANNTRGELVRREALELALYTFRYLPEADNVVVFLPPPSPEQQLPRAIWWQRHDLAPFLEQPLWRTLRPSDKPLVPGLVAPSERNLLEDVTEPRVYQYEFRQLQDGSALLFLAPL